MVEPSDRFKAPRLGIDVLDHVWFHMKSRDAFT